MVRKTRKFDCWKFAEKYIATLAWSVGGGALLLNAPKSILWFMLIFSIVVLFDFLNFLLSLIFPYKKNRPGDGRSKGGFHPGFAGWRKLMSQGWLIAAIRNFFSPTYYI